MFQHRAASGAVLLAGLASVLLSAPTSLAAGTNTARSGRATPRQTTTLSQRSASPRGSVVAPRAATPAPAATGSVTVKPVKPTPIVTKSAPKAAPKANLKLDRSTVRPKFRDLRGKSLARSGSQPTHGGGMNDFNLDGGSPFNEIEPSMIPGTYYFVLSSDRFGFDLYPRAGSEEDPSLEPEFLTGNDYHLYLGYLGNPGSYQLIPIGMQGEDRGEQFEPVTTFDPNERAKIWMAWSAFLPDSRDEYEPEATGLKDPEAEDPNADIAFDGPGVPVRVIQYSDDALGDNGTDITNTLPPVAFWFKKEVNNEDPDNPETTYRPLLVPDATPALYPQDPRFIVYVSLRGYDKDDPETHYSTLWVWDTSRELAQGGPFSSANPYRVLAIPGKSILQPEFSQDGRLAFTVADVSFPQNEDETLPDPVFDIDVTKKALNDPANPVFVQNARVYVSSASVNNGTFRVGTPNQVTTFEVVDEADPENPKAPRDMFPFWSPLGQLGFSSDRLDTDADQIADAVAEDKATALFDIYTFRFPLSIAGVENPSVPDETPLRFTLGPDPTADDANELYGTWTPLNPDSIGFGAVRPTILYQSDDSGTWDIWWTDYTGVTYNGNVLVGLPVITANPDLTADEKADIAKTRRIGLPGDWVKIAVRINPAMNPSDEVLALIKDPDNKIFDVIPNDHVNTPPDPQTWGVDVHWELDAYPVRFTADDIDHYQTKYADTPEDLRPKFGAIISLQPDAELGEGWYSARWYTPMEVSDFMLDISVNEQVTDNIGGFSTSPFVPANRVLLISDFAGGQRSIYYTSDTQTAAHVRTESYFTYRPHQNVVHPPGIFTGPWSVLGPRQEWQVAPEMTLNTQTGRYDLDMSDAVLNFNNPTVSDVQGLFMGAGLPSPWANFYDLWRVQCRQPISMDDLRHYLPYVHTQPAAPTAPTLIRNQRVADRMVVWMSPHTGQLNGNAGQNSMAGNGGINNLGMGTIANTNTQNVVRKYLDASLRNMEERAAFGAQNGRMLLSGKDVAFALTQEGNITNPLLTQFRVAFESHFQGDINGGESPRLEMRASRGVAVPGAGLNPIPYGAPYGGALHATVPQIQLAPPQSFVPFTGGGTLWWPRRVADEGTWDDGAWNQLFIDSVTALQISQPGGGWPIYHYGTSDSGNAENSEIAGVQSWQPITATENTSSRKTLYFAFGLEGINRFYYEVNSIIHTENRPAVVMHNAIDWMTTGAFTGQVFLTNNVTPVAGALVWALDVSHGENGGRIMGTATTDANGFYYMDGMDVSGYRLFAYKTGYNFQNPVADIIDTSINGISQDNLLLVPVQTGTLRGIVKDADTGAPLAGVIVRIRDIQNTVQLQTVTNAAGEYLFEAVPAGLYIVTIAEQTINDIEYGVFTNENNPKNVTSDFFPAPGDRQGDSVLDITLERRVVPAKPATLVVTVLDESGETPVPAVGAVVTVFDSVTGQPVATLDEGPNPVTTDETGVATFSILAGQVVVRVHYGTFRDQSRSMLVQPDETNPNGSTAVTFRFGGVIHVFPAGNILMASTPYNYTGTTASPLRFSDVLNLTDEQLDNAIVAFNSGTQDFVFYPTYPADTFRAGTGYGMKLPADGRVTEIGDPVPVTNGYYVVRANIGWNLIGNPFSGDIVWSKANATGGAMNVKFTLRDDASQTMHDIGDPNDNVSTSVILTGDIVWGASATDQHGNGVYNGNYAQHTVIRPWQSYWVKVAQPVLLHFPRVEAPEAQSVLRLDNQGNLAAARTTILPTGTAWGLDITASTGKLTDRGLGLGLSTRATAGLDAGLDIPKPSPLSAAGPSLFTSFVQPNNDLMATDVRNVGNHDWTFTVNTNLNAQNITLTWTPTGKLASGATLVLVDTATNQRVNMARTNQYTFRSARSGGLRRFRVELRGAVTNRTR